MPESSGKLLLLSGTSSLLEGLGLEDVFLLLIAVIGLLTFCWGLLLGLLCDPENTGDGEMDVFDGCMRICRNVINKDM